MKFSKILKRTLLRAFRPGRLIKAIRLQKRRKKIGKTWDDPQIKLYSDFLTNDMLHYGYFDNVDAIPEQMSISDIEKAQTRYTELFFEHISRHDDPVLDVGCGMGGLAHMLEQKGFNVEALTPDRHQIKYIGHKYPNIKLIQSKYQDYPDPEPRYGTIINAESFQYIPLSKILDITDSLLLPGGKWLVCDYFRLGESHERSGHYWEEFLEAIGKSNWTITYQQDITKNILPTLKYVNMVGERFIRPLSNYLLKKFEIKQPGLFFLSKDIVDEIPSKLDDLIEMVDPNRYSNEKKYMFLVLERTADLKD